MTQASISRNLYRMKISFMYFIYFMFLLFITSVITFLVFTGKTVNEIKDSDSQINVINGSDNLYRELSYQAVVIILLTIISFCVVFHSLKNIV